MMQLKLFYRLLLHDKKGRLVKDTGLLPAHSYVITFLKGMEGWIDAVYMGAKDVDNTTQTLVGAGSSGNTMYCDAAVGVVTHGVVVGTNDGSTPEANENYKLDTKILHSIIGTPGTFNYRAVTFVAPTEIGANIDFDVSRPFINETAGAITVKEVGLIVCSMDGVPSNHYFLLLRDVVSDFSVTAGFTLTVVYTLRTTA